MAEPARTWLTGFGFVLVPHTPFEIARRAGDEGVILAHHGQSGVRSVLVQPNPLVKQAGQGPAARLALGPQTSGVSEVLAFVEETDLVTSWTVVARADSSAASAGATLRCAFPDGTTLWSTPWDVSWPFEVTTGGTRRDEISYVQGPFAPAEYPPLDELVAAGMRRAGKGRIDGVQGPCEWLDLHYTFDSVEWQQRRAIVPLGLGLDALVTSQATAPNSAVAFRAAEELVASLALSNPSS